jgi:hypothetical protein
MTARAYEWLTESPSTASHSYKNPVGRVACDLNIMVFKATACSTEDIRALVLGKPYTVFMARRYPETWAKRARRTPTCEHCLVLLDKALENAAPKRGKYRDFRPDGAIGWVYPEEEPDDE